MSQSVPFENYKHFLLSKIKSYPNDGRGQVLEISRKLSIHTTTVSQLINGTRIINLEQAFKMSNYFELNELEQEYFLMLVNVARAGTKDLKNHFLSKLANLKSRPIELSERVKKDKNLSSDEQAKFYSSWQYSAVRNLIAIEHYNDIEAISKYFNLSRKKVSEIVDFLLKAGLCKTENGKLEVGSKSTHIGSNSDFIREHHTNWRLKNLERVDSLLPSELMYTSPMSLSKKDGKQIRENIARFIEDTLKIVGPSSSEEIQCLTIDWVKIK